MLVTNWLFITGARGGIPTWGELIADDPELSVRISSASRSLTKYTSGIPDVSTGYSLSGLQATRWGGFREEAIWVSEFISIPWLQVIKTTSNQLISKSEIKHVWGRGWGSASLGLGHKPTRKGRPETEPALWMMGLKMAPHQALHLLSSMWMMAKPAFSKGKVYSRRQILASIPSASLWRSRTQRQMDPNNSSIWAGQPTHFFTPRSSLEKS